MYAVYHSSDSFAQVTAVSIASLFENNKEMQDIEVFLIEHDISKENCFNVISIIESNGLKRSMSKKGCSPDNAACEAFFGRLKNEMFYNRNWQGFSVERFIEQVNEYIEWYNSKRIKLSLGAKSPIRYRIDLGLMA